MLRFTTTKKVMTLTIFTSITKKIVLGGICFLFFLLPKAVFAQTNVSYKINEVKNGSGVVLSQVKINVDGVYLHHYAPEIISFCEGCSCDGYVSCGFGQHTITLQKDGFIDWTDTRTINIGESFEVNPVMTEVAPTSIPTDEPTSIPTSVPTPISKATYKINKAKDNNGNELSSVKIYVDDGYTHHYDDEILTFCDNCHCDDEKFY